MVEHFPLYPEGLSVSTVRTRYRRILGGLARGEFKTEAAIRDAIDRLDFHWPDRWQFIKNFRTEELQCSIFGHICPVFFTWEAATETAKGRRRSRRVPRDVMLKVVRRDAGMCQICFRSVRDDEVQFDHLIPYARGGQTSVENLRLVHASCNKQKRDTIVDVVQK